MTSEHRRGASPLVLGAMLLFLVVPDASGGQVGPLTTFTNGTVADADEVNANFAALVTAVNDNHNRTTALESAGQAIMSQGLQPGPNGEVYGVYSQSGSEPFARLVMPRAGTLEDFRCRPTVTMNANSTVRVTLRLNGGEVSMPITFTSADGTTFKTSAGGPVAVSAGDLMTFRYQETQGGTPGAGFNAVVTLK